MTIVTAGGGFCGLTCAPNAAGGSILGFLFLGSEAPPCEDAADADDDGHLVITDAIYILASLFLGGPPPKAPYPAEGPDPTEDILGCRGY